MRIAITSEGRELSSNLDTRFGRCRYFIIYEMSYQKFEVFDNEGSINLSQSAGIQTAQTIVDYNIDVVITGFCGPKAFQVLNKAEIKVFTSKETKVEKALADFLGGKLEQIISANN